MRTLKDYAVLDRSAYVQGVKKMKNQVQTRHVLPRILQTMVFVLASGFSVLSSAAITKMNDSELEAVSGQSLFNLQYISPATAGNPNGDMGFYRLGLEGTLALNANIKTLQLGCGGVNGAGDCDIDLNDVRLAGAADSTGTVGGTGQYAGTDAQLTNPFFELAILHPGSQSTRQLAGVRLGSLGALGTLSVGQNPNTSNIADDTGVNTISGDLGVTVTNAQLTNVGVTAFGVCCIIGPGTATVTSYSDTFIFNRSSTLDLGATGSAVAGINGTKMSASMSGLTLSNVQIHGEPLAQAHNLLIAGNTAGTVPTKDFYLSVQSQPINWQKISTGAFNTIAAQTGWWISVPNVQINNITSNQSVRVDTLAAVGGLFGGATNITPVDFQQTPITNCYGGLKFC
jgi:hypothetical protein